MRIVSFHINRSPAIRISLYWKSLWRYSVWLAVEKKNKKKRENENTDPSSMVKPPNGWLHSIQPPQPSSGSFFLFPNRWGEGGPTPLSASLRRDEIKGNVSRVFLSDQQRRCPPISMVITSSNRTRRQRLAIFFLTSRLIVPTGQVTLFKWCSSSIFFFFKLGGFSKKGVKSRSSNATPSAFRRLTSRQEKNKGACFYNKSRKSVLSRHTPES